jgi:predicted O-methyltransferase YrrM
MSVNIENALKITGWMEDHSLVWLAEQAAIHNSIVEVGCWRGKSTTCLADNTSGIVYAVDHWKGSEEHQPVDEEKLYQMFLDQMAPYISAGKVVPLRMSSTEAAAKLASQGLTFDFVFIDASHDYPSVCADINAWKPLIRPGGLFCGHDAGYDPVERAANDLLPTNKHVGSMWVVYL